jgi:hypothetical protein
MADICKRINCDFECGPGYGTCSDVCSAFHVIERSYDSGLVGEADFKILGRRLDVIEILLGNRRHRFERIPDETFKFMLDVRKVCDKRYRRQSNR